jgi:hypothetical protein
MPFHLKSRVGMNGVKPLLPLFTFIAWDRASFTFSKSFSLQCLLNIFFDCMESKIFLQFLLKPVVVPYFKNIQSNSLPHILPFMNWPRLTVDNFLRLVYTFRYHHRRRRHHHHNNNNNNNHHHCYLSRQCHPNHKAFAHSKFLYSTLISPSEVTQKHDEGRVHHSGEEVVACHSHLPTYLANARWPFLLKLFP